jgi:hypothetical protein
MFSSIPYLILLAQNPAMVMITGIIMATITATGIMIMDMRATVMILNRC